MAAKPITTGSKPERRHGNVRGVPRAQYLSLCRMIARKETTWAELERQGIVLPPQNESDYTRQVRRQLHARKR